MFWQRLRKKITPIVSPESVVSSLTQHYFFLLRSLPFLPLVFWSRAPPQPEIFHFSESTSGNFIEGEREREEPCRHMKSCLLTLYSTPAKTSHYMRQGPPSNTSVLVYIFLLNEKGRQGEREGEEEGREREGWKERERRKAGVGRDRGRGRDEERERKEGESEKENQRQASR